MRTLRIIRPVLFSALGLTATTVGAADGPDANRGKQVYAACAACHSPDQPTKLGPDLRSVMGRTAGTRPDFRYSRAMKNSKIVWTGESLDQYLADPQGTIPGNAMPYPGLPDDKQRQDVIAYLKTLK